MNIVAIIPARGGSKRIPRKNVRDFAGKPMIAHAITAAVTSGVFSRVVVSTDDLEVAKIAREYGAESPFLRPEHLATDTAALMPVIRHALDELGKGGIQIDAAFCLYATAVFMNPARLQEAAAVLNAGGADFVLTVSDYDYPVQRSMKLDAQGTLHFSEPEYALSRSQDLDARVHDAGQFFGGTVAAIRKHDVVVHARCRPVHVPRYEAVDIDTPEDWRFAELLYQARKGLPA